jgi:hypothetical protein
VAAASAHAPANTTPAAFTQRLASSARVVIITLCPTFALGESSMLNRR